MKWGSPKGSQREKGQSPLPKKSYMYWSTTNIKQNMPAHNRSVRNENFFIPHKCPVKYVQTYNGIMLYWTISQGRPFFCAPNPFGLPTFLLPQKKGSKENSRCIRIAWKPGDSTATDKMNSPASACCKSATFSSLVEKFIKLLGTGRIYPQWFSVMGSFMHWLVEVVADWEPCLLAMQGGQAEAGSDSILSFRHSPCAPVFIRNSYQAVYSPSGRLGLVTTEWLKANSPGIYPRV